MANNALMLLAACAGLLRSHLAVGQHPALAPYPHPAGPPTTLRVYSSAGLSKGDTVTLETLGGGLARAAPELYRASAPVNSTSDSYSLWLRGMAANFGVKLDTSLLSGPADATVQTLLQRYKDKITGYVTYNYDATALGCGANAALTFVAGQARHELLIAVSTAPTLALVKRLGFPLAKDLTGVSTLDAYNLRAGSFSGRMISFQIKTQYSNLAEYAVFARAPTVEYACTGLNGLEAKKCMQKQGSKGGATAEAVVADMVKRSPGSIKVALGWGPESAYVSALGEQGFYVHASDDAHNVVPNAALASQHQRGVSQQPMVDSAPLPAPTKLSSPAAAKGTHKIAFLMSDGDNLQWMFNNFATDTTHWWGSPDRGSVPLGWTISPALSELGPVILQHLTKTKTANDDFVGAPSGMGYTYPSVMTPSHLAQFAQLTGQYVAHTAKVAGGMSAVNVIGDPCVGGTFHDGCRGLNSPNMSTIEPLLQQPQIDGLFWYTFGAGYSGWSGTMWGGGSGGIKKKPVVGGRFSLWGEATKGTMLGVKPLIESMKLLLFERKINRDASSANGYSLFPVHAWSHNVSDVVEVARALEETGNFEVITPSALLAAVAKNVPPQ